MSISHPALLSTLRSLKPKICQKIDELTSDNRNLKVSQKEDDSPVSEMDLYISDLIKLMLENQFPEINFFSEEDQGLFEYPVCILDPIDGTKEFIKGIPECAVSFGIYYSDDFMDPRNFSWIFNPFTGEEICSAELPKLPSGKEALKRQKPLALVSRTEMDRGLFESTESMDYKAVGSIAYKLALLAKGKCDFVITKRPKNVWDIAAGTHICMLQGFQLRHLQRPIIKIQKEKYPADMIWAPTVFYSETDSDFQN